MQNKRTTNWFFVINCGGGNPCKNNCISSYSLCICMFHIFVCVLVHMHMRNIHHSVTLQLNSIEVKTAAGTAWFSMLESIESEVKLSSHPPNSVLLYKEWLQFLLWQKVKYYTRSRNLSVERAKIKWPGPQWQYSQRRLHCIEPWGHL